MRPIVPAIVAMLAVGVPAGAATPVPLQRVHGKIVGVDAARGTFRLHHEPFPAMPMAMTMVVRAAHAADLKRLKSGETVDAMIDVNRDPWVASSIVVR